MNRLGTSVLLTLVCSQVLAAIPAESGPPLRLAEPVASIIDDLASFMPAYLRQKGMAGAAIALIHDGEVAWSGGFGVKNTITGQPVQPDTLFEVASNSKVVAAYIALRPCMIISPNPGCRLPSTEIASHCVTCFPTVRDWATLRRAGITYLPLVAAIPIQRSAINTCRQSSNRSPKNRWKTCLRQWYLRPSR